MRLLKLLPIVAILAFTVYLTSCQALPFPSGPSVADEYVTKSAVRRMYPPILLTDGDQLTYGTACQIIEHNVTYYCENPGSRPPGFPTKLCEKSSISVCEQVLGPPGYASPPVSTPSEPPRRDDRV